MEIESRLVQATEAECEPFESTKSAPNGRFVERSRDAQAAEPVSSTLQTLPSYILLNNPKIVDSLERLGYLKRGRSESDRRVIYAELTPEGSRVRARVGAVFESMMQAGLWDHLSAEETSGMVNLLERLQATLGLSQGSLMPPSD